MTKYGFTLIWEKKVDECKSLVRKWIHKKSGARLLSFTNNDENKVFGVSFRTPPQDSTGLPHILEHSVLCGSEKYPVREPFVELLKGSLQTFLNAFTYPDKTCYPVASTNLQDFRNLTDVYLDAVFFPRITEDILQQEGWHLEPDNEGNFIFKGVVYNEMKGVFSSPEAILDRASLHALFPDTPYSFESGGDPEVIPTLSYENFIKFHKLCYHPSNGRFFFWGDDNEDDRLAQLGEVLDKFVKQAPAPIINLQDCFEASKQITIPYAAGEKEEKGIITCNWLMADVTKPEISLALRILDHILLGMPASPLRRALIESGLGEDIAGGGLEDELRQSIFSIGLKGVKPKLASTVEKVITETLDNLIIDGIPDICVEAAINSVEFALREKNTGRYPVGLSVMLRSLTTWLHDKDPLTPLKYEEPLAIIKDKVESGDPYFECLTRRFFMDNPHKVTVILKPDSALGAKQAEEEKERVKQALKLLSEEEQNSLAAKAEALKLLQEAPDDPQALASIPRLEVKDLPKQESPIPSSLENKIVPIHYQSLDTSKIAYISAFFDLKAVPQRLYPLLPLLGRTLVEMGTKKQDFLTLNMTIACKTGGIYSSPLILTKREGKKTQPLLKVSGKATPDKIEDLFELFQEILLEPDFDDKDRFTRMVLEEKARLEHSLIPAGHTFTALRLKASTSVSGQMEELIGGISYYQYLIELADRVHIDWIGVLKDLEELDSFITSRKNITWNITSDESNKDLLLSLANKVTQNLPDIDLPEGKNWENINLPQNEAFILPAQVNYVGLGGNLYDSGYSYNGSIHVVLKQLRTGWLWEKVRVQGGAYGAFCTFDRLTGSMSFVSYRDPNIKDTLNVFKKTAEHLACIKLGQREIDSAIIGAIGEIDNYQLPDAKGMTAFIRKQVGDTETLRQKMREEIFQTTEKDFQALHENLLNMFKNAKVCIIGGSSLEQYALSEQDWEVKKLL